MYNSYVYIFLVDEQTGEPSPKRKKGGELEVLTTGTLIFDIK